MKFKILPYISRSVCFIMFFLFVNNFYSQEIENKKNGFFLSKNTTSIDSQLNSLNQQSIFNSLTIKKKNNFLNLKARFYNNDFFTEYLNGSTSFDKVTKKHDIYSQVSLVYNPSKRTLLGLPPLVITGFFSICRPGSSTTQLFGFNTPAAINPWTSLVPAVATVSNTGLVTFVSNGVTTITYADNLGNSNFQNITVANSPTITPPPFIPLSVCVGQSLSTPLTGSGTPHPTSPWTSSNNAIATVNNSGVITGVSSGPVTITYTDINGCSAQIPYTVKPNVQVGSLGLDPNPANTTLNQVSVTWANVPGATTYTIGYQVLPLPSPYVFVGFSPSTNYLVAGLLPSTNVQVFVTPSGPPGFCGETKSIIATTNSCTAAQTPSPPGLTTTQSTCISATNSIKLTGLPVGSWTIEQTGTATSNIVSSGSDYTFTNLAVGNYTFKVRNSVGCQSSGVNETINVQPSTPSVPILSTITQPTCTAKGSVILTGLPTGAWTINQIGVTSGNLTINGSGNSYTVNNLVNDSYTFSVKEGVCTSTVTLVPVVINAQPSTPSVPILSTITQPTCTAKGSVILAGLPTGAWTINQYGTVDNIITGTGSTKTIFGLETGFYKFKVTNSNSCFSPETAFVNINAILTIPNTPMISSFTQPNCSVPTGNIEISNLPSGNWELKQFGTVNNSIFSSGSSITIANLNTGSYTFNVTNDDGCTSSNSFTVNIELQPSIPSEPIFNIVQSTCTSNTNSINFIGLPIGNWTLSQFGSFTKNYTGNGFNFSINDLEIGNYTFTITNSDGCVSSTSLTAIIKSQPVTPEPKIENGFFCVNQETGEIIREYILDTKLDNTHSFVWYLNSVIIPFENNSTLKVGLEGDYSVIATNAFGCISNLITVAVSKSYIGQQVELVINGSIDDGRTVVANVYPPNDQYLYQLDNGPFQNENVFSSVKSGTHKVTVLDNNNNCTYLEEEVTIIGYPNFFTPNDDGFNDTWNIIGSNNQNKDIILIYDRYGVFIKQISAKGLGWDGTLNGNKLPSDDYWFTLNYEENSQEKIFKGHFSLKR